MTLTEVKKALYKANPELYATIYDIRHGIVTYTTYIEEDRVDFKVPVSDMGDTSFGATEPAKLLIRWIHGMETESTYINF